MSRPPAVRWPFEDLDDALRRAGYRTRAQKIEALGIPGRYPERTWWRWRAEGVPDEAADRAAAILDSHPVLIWGRAWETGVPPGTVEATVTQIDSVRLAAEATADRAREITCEFCECEVYVEHPQARFCSSACADRARGDISMYPVQQELFEMEPVPFEKRLTATVQEVAAMTGVCSETVRRRIADGTIPATRLGRRVLVLVPQLLDVLSAQGTAPEFVTAPPSDTDIAC